MICKNCKHNIGPGDLKCPNCGADNPFAVQHVKNMETFDKDYKKTKSEVVSSAQKTGGLAVRAVILIVLLIVSVIIYNVASYNYTDKDPDEAIRRESEKNAAALAQEAESLLKQGEYMNYMCFLQAHEISNFPPREFEHLRKVNYVVSDYYECIKSMEEIIMRSSDPDYFDNLDSHIFSFCMYLDSFYEVLEAQKSSEEDAFLVSCMEDMQAELETAIKTYFSMDDNDLKEFLSMSESKKGLKLTEVLRHE